MYFINRAAVGYKTISTSSNTLPTIHTYIQEDRSQDLSLETELPSWCLLLNMMMNGSRFLVFLSLSFALPFFHLLLLLLLRFLHLFTLLAGKGVWIFFLFLPPLWFYLLFPYQLPLERLECLLLVRCNGPAIGHFVRLTKIQLHPR